MTFQPGQPVTYLHIVHATNRGKGGVPILKPPVPLPAVYLREKETKFGTRAVIRIVTPCGPEERAVDFSKIREVGA